MLKETGGRIKKVHKGQINTLAKMLSALRRFDWNSNPNLLRSLPSLAISPSPLSLRSVSPSDLGPSNYEGI
jgi:hypothetical protein